MTDIIISALAKGNERFVVVCTPETRSEAMRTLGRWACDPELAFGWHDAAAMSREIREADCVGK